MRACLLATFARPSARLNVKNHTRGATSAESLPLVEGLETSGVRKWSLFDSFLDSGLGKVIILENSAILLNSLVVLRGF